jgi:hypothetical protein
MVRPALSTIVFGPRLALPDPPPVLVWPRDIPCENGTGQQLIGSARCDSYLHAQPEGFGNAMKKGFEYRQHAQECRALANKMEQGEHRDQLLRMAETWDRLADDRDALISRHPEIAQPDEAARPANKR